MFRRLILTLALTFLFGLGQQGVVAHQISHLDDLAPLSQKQDQSAHSVCDQCLAYSALAHASGVSPFVLSVSQPAFVPIEYQAVNHSGLTLRPYQARAPPKFI